MAAAKFMVFAISVVSILRIIFMTWEIIISIQYDWAQIDLTGLGLVSKWESMEYDLHLSLLRIRIFTLDFKLPFEWMFKVEVKRYLFDFEYYNQLWKAKQSTNDSDNLTYHLLVQCYFAHRFQKSQMWGDEVSQYALGLRGNYGQIKALWDQASTEQWAVYRLG